MNFKNRPVRTGDIKGGGPKQPPLATNRGSQEPATNRVKRMLVTGVPQDIAVQLATVGQGRERSTRQDADLALPRIRSESGRKRFLYRAVSAFNSLPVAVREQPPGAFKRNVKRRLGHF